MMEKQVREGSPRAFRTLSGFLIVLGMVAAISAALILVLSGLGVLDGESWGSARTQLIVYELGGAGILLTFLGDFLRGRGNQHPPL
jgi:ABC-type nickel/cobalt efflux system permease component RcnA